MEFLGQVVDIDLNTGSVKFSAFPDELTLRYLGGRGFNVQYLYQHLPADADPPDCI